MTSRPRVSVVMPVFNGAAYLDAAIRSVLAQTFTAWELLVIDDGSADESATLAAAYGDPRIRLLRNDGNRGLPYTRNRGIEEARGEYLAFLDSDDIALPQRLAVQIDFLDRHPGHVGIGGWVQPIDAAGNLRRHQWRYPGSPEYCRATLFFRQYFNTSTFTARTDALRAVRFSPEVPLAEDYDLFVRLGETASLSNLPVVLTHYRQHASSTTATKRKALANSLERVNLRQLASLGIAATPWELTLHRHIEWLHLPTDRSLLEAAEHWLRRIVSQNDERLVYEPGALRQAAGERWHALCEQGLRQGNPGSLTLFYGSPLWRESRLGTREHGRLLARGARACFA